MEKQAFTTAGINRLVIKLYALPQDQLNRSIRVLLTDYFGWIEQHIVLSPHQSAQLRALPTDFLFSCQQQIALALQLRVPIRLHKENQTRQHGEEGVGKMHGTIFALDQPQEPEPGRGIKSVPIEGFTYNIWYEEQ